MKKCTKCLELLDRSRFSKKRAGLKSSCKACVSKAKKISKENNFTLDLIIEKAKRTYKGVAQSAIMVRKVNEATTHLPKNSSLHQRLFHLETGKTSIDKCQHCETADQMFMTYKNDYDDFCSKECSKASNAKRRADGMKDYKKGYYAENREDLIAQSAKWQADHKEYRLSYLKTYMLDYHNRNPHIRAWRNCLRNTLTRLDKLKTDKTINMLGYSAGDLKEHLEKKFSGNMSWNNYGKWEVDHIDPVSSFHPDTPMNIVNALSNLQPLWKEDNMAKGNKILI